MSVAIVPTASAEWKSQHKGAVAAAEFFRRVGFKKIDFVDIEYQAPQGLANFDLIFLSGGNPCYLLRHLRRTGGQAILKQLYESGIYMVGSSAGAMILGDDIRIILSFDPQINSVGLDDFSGLRCIPFIVLPHADFFRNKFGDYKDSLQQIRRTLHSDVLEIDNDKGALFTDDVLEWI